MDNEQSSNQQRSRNDDAYERNNSRRRAYDLSDFEETPLSEIEGLGIANNRDWYQIEVSPGATNLSIELEFTHADGNLNLSLHNANGRRIARSNSRTDNESIDFESPEPGIYYIRVRPRGQQRGNSYDLVWDETVDEIVPIEFRSIDGSNNNLDHPDQGTPEAQLIRLSGSAYDDGISEPRGGDPSSLVSPREVSNAVFDQTESIPNSSGVSDWFWQWGQFLDHDLDLTPGASGESFNVLVPQGDPEFDPFNTGTQEISLTRSIFDSSTGNHTPREQVNEITAYIDGSNVYGSDDERAEALRTHDGTGKLKTSLSDNGEVLLPFNTEGLENENQFGVPGASLFVAGDVRANEQIGLTGAHTLFVREHNRQAENIAERLDSGDDELLDLFEASGLSESDFIYEAARRVVGAEIQAITYNEFVPLLVGSNALEDYDGYNSSVNSEISNEFSTAAFRFGHTMLSPQIERINPDGTPEESVSLRNGFFNPNLAIEDGIDSVLLGLASQEAQEIDTQLIDDVRNLLFGPPGAGGSDLASLNIQRGRDHGLPSYTEVREELDLDPITNFSQITSDPTVQAQLASVYDSVDDIDLWVGGLAEDQVNGALVGETFQAILVDQFTRSRDGDRFYYENDEVLSVLAPDVDQTTLSDVIVANSAIDNIQSNVFLA
ncbi:MAG: peroxidase family protein [Cyanobacteria bacterium J06592_8]